MLYRKKFFFRRIGTIDAINKNVHLEIAVTIIVIFMRKTTEISARATNSNRSTTYFN